MRALRLLTAVLFLAPPLAAQSPRVALMPMPREVALNAARLRLDSATTVAITGYRDARLERGVDRAVRRLEARLAFPLPRTYPAATDARIVIRVAGQGFAVPDLREDESYRLRVNDQGALLEANTVVGALRGLETLLQLQATDAQGFYLAGATISDAPRFPWRGMLLDVSRHWEPPEVVRRTLDGMAMLKLNVLHWHLSDDQGFRVESRRYPALHQQGSDGHFYTQDQIRDIVAYATDRGIRVVPEFDMPGHTTSWFVGHPELASAPGPYAIERRWGVFPPTIDPTRETTWTLLAGFVAEMVELFPDRYWHVGGDEVDPAQWRNSASIQQWMSERKLADIHALQTWFNGRLFEILAEHQRTPVGWDEILQPGLPTGAVIQSWRGTEGLIGATGQGRQALLSAPYYLDHMKTAAEMYLTDPLPEGLSAAQAALVLGGEACMWAEYVTMETVESRIWPRMGALAERFWSPASVRDVAGMYRRLATVSRQLGELGIPTVGHTERMLARIAPREDVPALREFLEYARPRGFAGRGTNQLSPLTRLIDAANPDPFTEWEMRALADSVDQPAARDRLAAHFRRMIGFDTALRAMTARAPIAADGLPVAAALADLGQTGLAALDRIARGAPPDAAWRRAADSVIARTDGKTFGLLRPVGAAAVKAVVAKVPAAKP
jgi:hexosaminidase